MKEKTYFNEQKKYVKCVKDARQIILEVAAFQT